MLRRDINEYHFLADPKTGITFRWGKTLDDDPSFAPVPELADISISNHCSKGCSFCYKNSRINYSFMSVEDYCFVLDTLCHPQYGSVFQVAIGGGEPLEHPQLYEILDSTIERGIVPNITTNGLFLNESAVNKLSSRVGALAISVTDILSIDPSVMSILHGHNVKTNIHFVLSSRNLSQALQIVNGEFNHLISAVNSIVFLTYKPAGGGKVDYIIKENAQLQLFLDKIQSPKCACKIGFDACFVPLIMRYTNIDSKLIDTCEGAFFSVYIDENLMVSPCSFSGSKDKYSLREFSFYDIWINKFDSYRKHCINSCTSACRAKLLCRGYCPYYPIITTCYQND